MGSEKTIIGAEQQIDIVEYFALLQYLTIAKEIQKIYPPGVQYNIFIGDAYYEYLYGRNKDVHDYFSGMESLINIFDANCFNLFSLEKFHQKDDGLLIQCNLNYEILYRYWIESSVIPEKEWIKLESYNILCQNGWVGNISPAMREHYLTRLDALFPHFNDKEKVEAVLRFFAYGMMVSQNDLFGRKDPFRCTADFCLLRIPPPGIPKSLHGNRLRKRIIPAKLTNRTAPPWTVKGALLYEKESSLLKPFLIKNGENMETFKKTIISLRLFDQWDLKVEMFE